MFAQTCRTRKRTDRSRCKPTTGTPRPVGSMGRPQPSSGLYKPQPVAGMGRPQPSSGYYKPQPVAGGKVPQPRGW